METWIDDLAKEVVARLERRYHGVRCFLPASVYAPNQLYATIEWAEPVDDPRLKVQSLNRQILFYADKCSLYIIDICTNSFPYADPDFPDTLYRSLGL